MSAEAKPQSAQISRAPGALHTTLSSVRFHSCENLKPAWAAGHRAAVTVGGGLTSPPLNWSYLQMLSNHIKHLRAKEKFDFLNIYWFSFFSFFFLLCSLKQDDDFWWGDQVRISPVSFSGSMNDKTLSSEALTVIIIVFHKVFIMCIKYTSVQKTESLKVF